MKSVRTLVLACGVAALTTLVSQPLTAQGRSGAGGRGAAPSPGTFDPRSLDPMAGPLVTGAPFSAEATTTVTQTLADGTRIEEKTTAKFYRDGTGRVRREQTIIGLDRLNPSAETQTIVTFDSEPGDTMPYLLDPSSRTARRVPRPSAVGVRFPLLPVIGGFYFRSQGAPDLRLRVRRQDLDGAITDLTALRVPLGSAAGALAAVQQGLPIPQRVPIDLRPTEEPLGTREVEGLKATGRRTTILIPAGRVGNDRPIAITDERWDSPELSVVVSSRFSDPRTGVVDYRLTHISRAEPSPGLFMVPSDYTVVGGGRGGRGDGTPGAGRRGGGSPQP